MLTMPDAVRRTLRTLLWALMALVPVIPGAAALFDLSAATTGKVSGVMALAVTVVTLAVNYGEDRAGRALLVAKANPDPEPTPPAEGVIVEAPKPRRRRSIRGEIGPITAIVVVILAVLAAFIVIKLLQAI